MTRRIVNHLVLNQVMAIKFPLAFKFIPLLIAKIYMPFLWKYQTKSNLWKIKMLKSPLPLIFFFFVLL